MSPPYGIRVGVIDCGTFMDRIGQQYSSLLLTSKMHFLAKEVNLRSWNKVKKVTQSYRVDSRIKYLWVIGLWSPTYSTFGRADLYKLKTKQIWHEKRPSWALQMVEMYVHYGPTVGQICYNQTSVCTM